MLITCRGVLTEAPGGSSTSLVVQGDCNVGLVLTEKHSAQMVVATRRLQCISTIGHSGVINL